MAQSVNIWGVKASSNTATGVPVAGQVGLGDDAPRGLEVRHEVAADAAGVEAEVSLAAVPGLGQLSEGAGEGGPPVVVLQKVASELHLKVRNHGEGPY